MVVILPKKNYKLCRCSNFHIGLKIISCSKATFKLAKVFFSNRNSWTCVCCFPEYPEKKVLRIFSQTDEHHFIASDKIDISAIKKNSLQTHGSHEPFGADVSDWRR